MKISTIVRALVAAKATPEMILAAVEAAELEAADAVENSREKGRERWRRWKEKQDANVSKRLQTTANDSYGGVTRGDVKQNNLEIQNSKKDNNAPKTLSDLNAFKAELVDVLDDERIVALCSVRKQKRAGFSARAGKGLAAKLRTFSDPSKAADEMIIRGWVGIEHEWLDKRPKQTAPPDRQRSRTILDVIDERLEREDASSNFTIDHEPITRQASTPDLCFPAITTGYRC